MNRKCFFALMLLTLAALAPAATAPAPTPIPAPAPPPWHHMYGRPADLERCKALYVAQFNPDNFANPGAPPVARTVLCTTSALPNMYVLVRVWYKEHEISGMEKLAGDRYVINAWNGGIEPCNIKSLSGAFKKTNCPTDEDKNRLIQQLIDLNERQEAQDAMHERIWRKIGSVKDIPGYENSRGQRRLDKDLEALIKPQWQGTGASMTTGPCPAVTCFTYTWVGSGCVRRYQFLFSESHDFLDASCLDLGRGIGNYAMLE